MNFLQKVSILLLFTAHLFVLSHMYEAVPDGSSVPIVTINYCPTRNNDVGYDRIVFIKEMNKHQYLSSITHFRNYKAQDFQNYCAYLGYSEQEILLHHKLYRYKEFIRFIKSLSGYEHYVAALHKKLCKTTGFKKLIRCIEGMHYRGFTEKVRCLYEQDFR